MEARLADGEDRIDLFLGTTTTRATFVVEMAVPPASPSDASHYAIVHAGSNHATIARGASLFADAFLADRGLDGFAFASSSYLFRAKVVQGPAAVVAIDRGRILSVWKEDGSQQRRLEGAPSGGTES